MHRLHAAACLLLLAPAACKIERTPPEFYSHTDEAAVERDAGEAELRARVGAFREALSRGDRGAAVLALAPTPDASVLGPGEGGGMAGQGPAGIARAFAEMAPGGGRALETPDLRVDVSVRQNMGWFATHLAAAPGGAAADSAGAPAAGPLRMSGVFERAKGEWRLVQLHVSRPEAPVGAAPADSARADSAAAPDSAVRDSARR